MGIFSQLLSSSENLKEETERYREAGGETYYRVVAVGAVYHVQYKLPTENTWVQTPETFDSMEAAIRLAKINEAVHIEAPEVVWVSPRRPKEEQADDECDVCGGTICGKGR